MSRDEILAATEEAHTASVNRLLLRVEELEQELEGAGSVVAEQANRVAQLEQENAELSAMNGRCADEIQRLTNQIKSHVCAERNAEFYAALQAAKLEQQNAALKRHEATHSLRGR
jgi:hypothetical protein